MSIYQVLSNSVCGGISSVQEYSRTVKALTDSRVTVPPSGKLIDHVAIHNEAAISNFKLIRWNQSLTYDWCWCAI